MQKAYWGHYFSHLLMERGQPFYVMIRATRRSRKTAPSFLSYFLRPWVLVWHRRWNTRHLLLCSQAYIESYFLRLFRPFPHGSRYFLNRLFFTTKTPRMNERIHRCCVSRFIDFCKKLNSLINKKRGGGGKKYPDLCGQGLSFRSQNKSKGVKIVDHFACACAL